MKKYRLLSLLTLIGALCFYSSGSHAQTSTMPANPYFIPVDSANKMLRSYLTSVNADIDSNKQLQALIMDADALREYLSNPSIKKVKVMFAHTLDYINAGHGGENCGYTPGQLTIIFAGYDSENNYIFAPGNLVPNRAKPCPTNCSVTGTAANMYLQ